MTEATPTPTEATPTEATNVLSTDTTPTPVETTPTETVVEANIETAPAEEPKGLFKPADDADKEAWDAFYNELGRPTTADEYNLSELNTEALEDLGLSNDGILPVKNLLHESGLTQAQAEKVWDGLGELISSQAESKVEQLKTSFETTMQALNAEWGEQTKEQIKSAQEAMNQLGLTDVVAKFNLHNEPEFIKKLSEVGKLFNSANGNGILKAGVSNSISNSPQNRAEQIQKLVKQQYEARSAGNTEAMRMATDALNRIMQG